MTSNSELLKILPEISKNHSKKDNEKYFNILFKDALNNKSINLHQLVSACYFWNHYTQNYFEEVYKILSTALENAPLEELLKVKSFLKNYVYYEQYGFENIQVILSEVLGESEWEEFVAHKDEIDRLRCLKDDSTTPEAEVYRLKNRIFRVGF